LHSPERWVTTLLLNSRPVAGAAVTPPTSITVQYRLLA
jgi:hypothetical protein